MVTHPVTACATGSDLGQSFLELREKMEHWKGSPDLMTTQVYVFLKRKSIILIRFSKGSVFIRTG